MTKPTPSGRRSRTRDPQAARRARRHRHDRLRFGAHPDYRGAGRRVRPPRRRLRALHLLVTVAKLRFGAHHAGWGPARLQKLEGRLSTAETVWPGPSLVESYIKLRRECAAIGHGLSQK